MSIAGLVPVAVVDGHDIAQSLSGPGHVTNDAVRRRQHRIPLGGNDIQASVKTLHLRERTDPLPRRSAGQGIGYVFQRKAHRRKGLPAGQGGEYGQERTVHAGRLGPEAFSPPERFLHQVFLADGILAEHDARPPRIDPGGLRMEDPLIDRIIPSLQIKGHILKQLLFLFQLRIQPRIHTVFPDQAGTEDPCHHPEGDLPCGGPRLAEPEIPVKLVLAHRIRSKGLFNTFLDSDSTLWTMVMYSSVVMSMST